MKSLWLAAALLISTSAFANPFDAFVGDYKVSGSPKITSDKPRWCNWMDFQNIVGLKVIKNASIDNQSHILSVQSKEGQMEFPIMDFQKSNLFNTRGSYAKTSGTSTSAFNESGTWGADQNEYYIASLQKTATGYVFNLTETILENSAIIAACYYRVELTKP